MHMQRQFYNGGLLAESMRDAEQDSPSPNPLRTVQAYLTAVVRSIEPQLEQLFKQAVDGGWSELFLYESIEEAVDAIHSLLATLEKLPAFISWSFTFEQGADGRWFI